MGATALTWLLLFNANAAPAAQDWRGVILKAGGLVQGAEKDGLLVRAATPDLFVYWLTTPARPQESIRQVKLSTLAPVTTPTQWRAMAGPLALIAQECLGATPNDVTRLQAWLSDPLATHSTYTQKFDALDVHIAFQLDMNTFERLVTIDLSARAGLKGPGCVHSFSAFPGRG